MAELTELDLGDGTSREISDAKSRANFAPEFSASTSYAVDDIVTHEGVLYKCTTAHSAGAWNSAHFTQTTCADAFSGGGKQTTIIDLSESNVVLDESLTDTVTVTYSGAAATFTSSDTSVATVDVTSASAVGNTYTYVITITAKKEGACSIEVNVPENSSYYGAKAYINVTVAISIYGVEWDGSSSPAWTRTDMATNFVDPVPYYSGMSGSPSSPFDNIMPWAGMRIVEDAEAGTLVEIPKFYMKWTFSGSVMKLQISMKPFAGSYVSPAHADRGDGVGERDYVYVGRFPCGSNGKSAANVEPLRRISKSNARTTIHALGNDVWQWDISMYSTIIALYLVEFANWNSQSMIGYGGGNNSETENTSAGDNVPYNTGTPYTSRDTYGIGVQYRWIKSLWDNILTWIDGVIPQNNQLKAEKNLAKILANDWTDSENIGTFVNNYNYGTSHKLEGKVTTWNTPNVVGYEGYMLPKTAIINETNIYTCDYISIVNDMSFMQGGSYMQNQRAGLFNSFAEYTSTVEYGNIGSRLMKLPANRL